MVWQCTANHSSAAIVPTLSLLVAAWAALALEAQDSTKREVVRKTPSLIGKQLVAADQTLRLHDLACETGVFYLHAQNWREEIEAGAVYLQSPQPETPIKPGHTVAVWVFKKATGEQRIIKTPSLKGKTAKEAAKMLAEANLTAMRLPRDEDALPEPEKTWVVYDQYPRPGQPVYEKTSVHLRFHVPSP